jgi:hypothetical protein
MPTNHVETLIDRGLTDLGLSDSLSMSGGKYQETYRSVRPSERQTATDSVLSDLRVDFHFLISMKSEYLLDSSISYYFTIQIL